MIRRLIADEIAIRGGIVEALRTLAVRHTEILCGLLGCVHWTIGGLRLHGIIPSWWEIVSTVVFLLGLPWILDKVKQRHDSGCRWDSGSGVMIAMIGPPFLLLILPLRGICRKMRQRLATQEES